MPDERDIAGESPSVHVILHDGIITFVSSTSAQVSGIPPERFHGKRAIDLVHEDDRDRLQRFTAPGWEGIIDVTFRVRDADGAWSWRHAEGVRTIERDGTGNTIISLRRIDPPDAAT
jgi:PAS domain S-box-containing protein